ncbi:MAG: Type 1 glutamine amidotransferase-like domain-containing protein [Spirochaetaceae bacterium]|nr:Type 1 glutamine amidotransferase-like domain-containing protein [Spirochaetaceae bacterium]
MAFEKLNAKLLGLFSGFPTHHFTDEIAEVLREHLSGNQIERKCLVFISALPEEYAQNDDDSDGMHQMFAERGMGFAEHHVIDRRTSAEDAVKLLRQADCIWLMGGEVTWQMKLIQDLNLAPELKASNAVILGVSAGSMNLGRYVAEIWESKSFYDGLGLSDTIIKAHYSKDEWFMPILKELSMIHPLIAMEDESAIFINRDKTWKLGNMYQISKGEITSLSQLPKL